MKAILYLIIDADKKYWVNDTEEKVIEAFNEDDGLLPMKLIKITVDCSVPVAQEIYVTVPESGDLVTTIAEEQEC